MNTEKEERRQPTFEMKGILKQFGATTALNHVDFAAYPGEVIGLIGPNGAGKSTLMGTLTGVVAADGGTIAFSGNELPMKQYHSLTARNQGISCAYQEFSLCPNLRVYENIAITCLKHNPIEKFGWRGRMIRAAQKILDEVFPEHGISAQAKVSALSIEKKQMVEICCAIAAANLKILILDEPTSSLTNDRIGQLHHAIDRLREEGVTVIYISHKLDEIIRISTRIIVMQNGVRTWEGDAVNTTTEDLVDRMGGKIVPKEHGEKQEEANAPASLVEISHLCTKQLKDISLTVKRGEIVGISGLGGSGQRELLHALYEAAWGKRRREIKFSGSASFVSGDRQNEGIFALWSIADNIIISSLEQLTSGGLIDRKKSEKLAQSWYDKLKFKAESKDAPITSLSGGNQQKAIIGRGIASGADLIIFDDPTRGVDIETKLEIYQTLDEIRSSGKSVVWYSTEDNEMLECDRVYVMKAGGICRELTGKDISVDHIVAASFVEETDAVPKEKKQEDIKHQRPRSFSLFSNGSVISLLVFLCIWVIVSILNKNANTRTGLSYLIGSAVPLVFISIAQMFIVLCGDINLGIGNAMGLVNVLAATVYVQNPRLGILAFLAFFLAYGAVAVLIHVRNMPSIVVSLGMSSVWLGAALIILPTPGGTAIPWLDGLLKRKTPLFPIQVYVCILAAAAAYWIVFRSKYGMILRGIGSNPAAVTRRGWSCLLAHVTVYLVSGIFVLLAGISLTGVSKGADPNGSAAYQMMSIAVILLGGCAFSGGIVEPFGVAAAALSVSLISSMLTFMQISSNYRTAVIGLILLLTLVAGQILKREEAP